MTPIFDASKSSDYFQFYLDTFTAQNNEKIILATSNAGKIKELNSLLRSY
ncbi:Uncharacterised protein [Legionella sainthelensi]|nr:Uncharacterised protein [Legionella sainthelensi]